MKKNTKTPIKIWNLKNRMPRTTLKESLDRIYEVRPTIVKNKVVGGHCYLPKILVGEKFKLVMVKDGD